MRQFRLSARRFSRGPAITALVFLAFPVTVFADRATDVVALEARCEADREAKIKPLREMEIVKCEANRNDADYCERFCRDYGNPMRMANGKMSPRMFNDLPSCLAAFKARSEFDLNGR